MSRLACCLPASIFAVTSSMTSTAPKTPDRWSLDSWFTAFGARDYIELKTKLVHEVEAMSLRTTALGADPSRYRERDQ